MRNFCELSLRYTHKVFSSSFLLKVQKFKPLRIIKIMENISPEIYKLDAKIKERLNFDRNVRNMNF